jgi:transcriptional regulator with XRE-family HTH domain
VRWTDQLGEALRIAREDKRLSRPELARLSGISAETIADFELNRRRDGGEVNPKEVTVRSLAMALDDGAFWDAIGLKPSNRHSIIYDGPKLTPSELEYVLAQIDFARSQRRR